MGPPDQAISSETELSGTLAHNMGKNRLPRIFFNPESSPLFSSLPKQRSPRNVLSHSPRGHRCRRGCLPSGGACAPRRLASLCVSKDRSVASLCPNPSLPSAPHHGSVSLSDTLGHSWLHSHMCSLLGHIGTRPGDPDAPPTSRPLVASVVSFRPRQGANSQLSGIGRWHDADGGCFLSPTPSGGPPGRPLSLGAPSSVFIN